MGNNFFRFKRFIVEQEGCAMRVGTDGVLLGAWCRIYPQDKLLLDIGTGTGVIAIQLAQRTEPHESLIDAVEINEPSCMRARENFDRSEWSDRLKLHNISIQNFTRNASPESYDHIVSNPPYFNGALTSPDAARTQARHTGALSYGELTDCCDRLLKPDGRFSLILPSAEAMEMSAIVTQKGFRISRKTEVWTTPKSGAKRILLEFSRKETEPEISALIIEDAGPGSFSEEYRTLTRDFYLNF